MLRNYFDVALRSFLGNKLFSLINVFGLAVGLASAIMIGLYVVDELSYDRFHPQAERIYRIGRDFFPVEGADGTYLATLPVIAAQQLAQDYPEFDLVVRASQGRGLLARDDQAFYEDALLYADQGLFDLFEFEFVAGDAASALTQPDSIVLSESLARKYFGDEPAVGHSLLYENRSALRVTGVIRDLPANTHLRADALRPMSTLLDMLPANMRTTSWNANIMHTYARLAPDADIDTLASTFPAFIDRHVQSRSAGARASSFTGIAAMMVSDIHLRSTRQNEMREPGSMSMVMVLAAVAAGIVLIACFNFMNLATARSLLRGKEVGVRKTLGAERKQLVLQFLGESLGMVLLAMLIAIVLVEVALPAFNGLVGKELAFDPLREWRLQVALGFLIALVGLGAGFYPALHLSAFKPAQVLKSNAGTAPRDIALRNLLVILQFSISIVLVVATIVVGLQIRYLHDFDPGFDKEQIVVLNGSPNAGLTERWPALRQELLRHPGVVNVTASNLVPGAENLIGIRARAQGKPESENTDFSTLITDYDFLATYRVDLLAGRSFSADFTADQMVTVGQNRLMANFVLNASAARVFGWTPEQAVGQLIQTGTEDATTISGQVIGVVADSNFESLRFSVPPMLFLLGAQGPQTGATFSAASIRVTGVDIAGTLDHIDSAWKRVIPELPVMRRFLREDFDALYQDDARLGQMFTSFAVLAILVACLGLFGLAKFNTQRRIKEIGIRKVMGGSVWSIVLLLTNDFSKLVLIANVIAWPAAYFAMQRWLENFAYRIDLTPLVFIGSGLIALCVAWVTVGGTAAKAASANPVLALRYE